MEGPEVRKMLLDVWQRSAVEAVQRGISKRAVADTMLTIALAMLVEAVGKADASEQLAHIGRLVAQQGDPAPRP